MTSDYSQLLSLAVHEMRTPAGIVGGYLRISASQVAQNRR